MDVGGVVQMNITFLSPITPNDLQRQSLPFSYVDVAVSSTDGNSHNVQLYADISAGKYSFSHRLSRAKTSKNGVLVNGILRQLRPGTMAPLEMSRITRSIAKSRSFSPKVMNQPLLEVPLATVWPTGATYFGQRTLCRA